jgi:hypothetical protein
MLEDSQLATRLLTLGVALFAFGLGCHLWVDRVYRVAGLAIGTIQTWRYLLTPRIGETKEVSAKHTIQLRTCDHVTAVLLVMAIIHTVTTLAM